MKSVFVIIVFAIGVYGYSQPRFGYDIVKKCSFAISSAKTPSKYIINDYNHFIDSVIKIDQIDRLSKQSIMIRSDSCNALAYFWIIKSKGYLTTDINNYWLPVFGLKSKPDCSIKGNNNMQMKLLMQYNKRNVLHLHFCDRFGVYLMDAIEHSVATDSTCSEEDLMDFVITYLFRKTEFKIDQFMGNYYSIILMPDLLHGSYAHYYNYAVKQYMRYAFRKNPDVFRYVVFDNLFISKNNKLDWSKISTSPVYENLKVVHYLRNGELNVKFLDKYIIYWNVGIRKNCNYSIIFCRHDGVQQPRCGD